jgi:uncharacterized membrane protein
MCSAGESCRCNRADEPDISEVLIEDVDLQPWGRVAANVGAIRNGSSNHERNSSSHASWFQNVWQGVYIVTMVVLVATITVSALSLREDKPKAFWTLVIVAVLVVVVLTCLVWWR